MPWDPREEWEPQPSRLSTFRWDYACLNHHSPGSGPLACALWASQPWWVPLQPWRVCHSQCAAQPRAVTGPPAWMGFPLDHCLHLGPDSSHLLPLPSSMALISGRGRNNIYGQRAAILLAIAVAYWQSYGGHWGPK